MRKARKKTTPTRTVSKKKQLVAVLRQQAMQLRGASSPAAEAALWSVLRKLGAIAPVESVGWFANFLDASNPRTTRQAALQSIQATLTTEKPVENAETVALRKRLDSLARKFIKPGVLTNGSDVAFAANIYCAAILAGKNFSQKRLRAALAETKHAGLIRLSEQILKRVKGLDHPSTK